MSRRRSPAARLMKALHDAYPECNIPGSYWLGAGYLHLRPSSNGKRVALESLWVAPNRRAAGHGTLMLDTLTTLADREGVELTARVLPFGWGDRVPAADLRAWYKRWGFEPRRRGRAAILYRTPR